MQRIAKAVLPILLVAAPILFVWHVEIIYPIGPSVAGSVTNGVVWFKGSHIYHATMYLLFLVNATAAAYIITR